MRIATLRIYRFDPHGLAGPQLDMLRGDLDVCGPMLLDALFWVGNRIGPALTFGTGAVICAGRIKRLYSLAQHTLESARSGDADVGKEITLLPTIARAA
ncbi:MULTISPECIES: succinate dehydrogenase and fumarate reductase iron-sulfur protein [Paracoccus]|uniref:Uncharacterized protein n=1 Tax=Paracoccus kondratievae TaxID=135740 RepID=A0AAD3NVU9_9RHOB|nr:MULTISPECIES: succinate dehydrogenase and fumarate reductase iron-sulfur protein [Paracoccus]MDQ7263982.1 hypothetical protein [Paracoccus sp. PS1]RNI16183.1 hypothetical protein EB844_14770 [Paracoccus pantotrophus]UFS67415.1 hypothetical protein LO749_15005 [Paracoccus denitrificans]SMG54500.1 hypothetical protein SAMN02746000_03575 [Paracoccus sp. J56]GLK63656.1 hypothetical protein GCM10017635_11260 [Paracoccus kondratievae]